MIHLWNKVNTNKDNQENGINIKITGLDLEKLYEELFSNNNFKKSNHPKIFYAMKNTLIINH